MTKKPSFKRAMASPKVVAGLWATAFVVLMLTMFFTSMASAGEEKKKENDIFTVGILFSCKPVPKERDYVCIVRFIKSNDIPLDKIPSAPASKM
jgi:hypothetical protein